jgi:hypothetical protein
MASECKITGDEASAIYVTSVQLNGLYIKVSFVYVTHNKEHKGLRHYVASEIYTKVWLIYVTSQSHTKRYVITKPQKVTSRPIYLYNMASRTTT